MSKAIAEVEKKDYPTSAEIKKAQKILERTNTENPSKEDVAALRKLLIRFPNLWQAGGELAEYVRLKLIQTMSPLPLVQEFVKAGAKYTCRSLGYDDAPEIERLLIEQVVLCWLRLNLLEATYTAVRDQQTMTIDQENFLEKRLDYAQRRYLRACETLARVRKIARRTPALQVNIAADGGQQVNVAGDVRPANSKLAS
ncbi:MAG: hypothetical protein H8D43_04545 [Chloroflexi bacterium]|nr:hypothetical protein [Chloroflexota bacterium]